MGLSESREEFSGYFGPIIMAKKRGGEKEEKEEREASGFLLIFANFG